MEVESELTWAPNAVADRVVKTLNHPKGWTSVADVGFVQVVRDPEVRVLVATPETTDSLCAPLQTNGRVSCRNGSLVVLNARRWGKGVPHYEGRLTAYRRYLVNHEVGHALGRAHGTCPGPGAPAPVMMQQTYGLAGCVANAWPAVAG